jgi:hypothetical protein
LPISLSLVLLGTLLSGLPSRDSAAAQSRSEDQPGQRPSSVELILEDSRQARISLDQAARYGVFAFWEPERLPARYASDAPFGEGDVTGLYLSFLSDWERLAPGTQKELKEFLEDKARALRSPRSGSDDTQTVEAQSAGTYEKFCGAPIGQANGTDYECKLETVHFDILYNLEGGLYPTYGVVGDDELGENLAQGANGVPDYVDVIAASLEDGWAAFYDELGYFRGLETWPVVVGIDDAFGPGTGWTPNYEFIELAHRQVADYLPRHELFHSFQHIFLQLEDLGFDGILWWMEATAEWAAHESMLRRPPRSLSSEATEYDNRLPDFLGLPDVELSHFDTGPSETLRQYGAFLFAEFLEEYLAPAGSSFEPSVIRSTWQQIGQLSNLTALEAIEQVVGAAELPEAVAEFWRRNHFILQYLDTHDQEWEAELGDDPRTQNDALGGPRPARQRYNLTNGVTTLSSETHLRRGGALYADLMPFPYGEQTGTLTVTVQQADPDLRFFLRKFSTWPSACGDWIEISIDPQGNGELAGESIGGSCPFATLVVTHTDPVRGETVLPHWEARFDAINQPPVVSAGPDKTGYAFDAVQLDGTVDDDGLPGGGVSTTWAKVSGPGMVTFVDPSAPSTTASFDLVGTYVLELTANDGELSSADQVTVTISEAPASQSPYATTTVLIDPGAVSTFAGDGTQGLVDGTGTSARFQDPSGTVVVDGFAYVADSTAIRQVNLSTGEVTTLAGTAQPECVDSSDPQAVRFTGLAGLTTDGTYLYSTSSCGTEQVVRRTSIATGATSEVAAITNANRLTFGPDGYLYVTTAGSKSVVRLDRISGATSTVTSFAGDPYAITSDATYLWVAVWGPSFTDRRIYRVSVADGTSTQFLSEPGINFNVLDSAGAYLYGSSGDPAASGGSNTGLRRYEKATGAWVEVAGNPAPGYADGTGTDAWFGNLRGIASDGTALWLADADNKRIRRVVDGTPLSASQSPYATTTVLIDPGAVSTFAGDGTQGLVDGTGTSARFQDPSGTVVVDGFAYVADSTAIRQVNLSTGEVTTLAGTAQPECVDSSDPQAVRFTGLAGLTTDGTYLYSTSSCGTEQVVRRTSIATGATSEVAAITNANRLTFGPDGYLYVTTAGSKSVVRLDRISGATSTVTSFAGDPYAITSDATYLWVAVWGPSFTDRRIYRVSVADGTSTQFLSEPGINFNVLDSAGAYLYGSSGDPAASGGSNTGLRRYEKATGAWVEVAGNPAPGYADGTGTDAWFGNLRGIASDGTALWLADADNKRIRRVVDAP